MKENIIVSRAGFDVFTALDKDIAFNSNHLTHKIHQTGTVSITIPATGINTITVAHGLGYVPLCEAWANIPNLGWMVLPATAVFYQDVAGTTGPTLDFATNSTHLIIKGGFIDTNPQPSISISVRYILFKNRMI